MIARVVSHWLPWYGHPDGPAKEPWFRVVDGWGYRTASNPRGASKSPCFRLVDGFAYPVFGLPDDAPMFEIVGSFAYAGSGRAWFRVDERVT